jgi:hypothetical protein
MPNRVNGAMQHVEAPAPHAVVDRGETDPRLDQLTSRDHSVLPPRRLGDPPIHRPTRL